MNLSNLISIDFNKISFLTCNNTTIVRKKTNSNEFDNLIMAKNFLSLKSITINNILYSLDVPDILNWDPNEQYLDLSFCQGDNLELLLRNKQTRDNAKAILESLFNFILSTHFYWFDFAPRNILIDNINGRISLVDFEKGLNFETYDVLDFLRNRVYEEYSSFLLPSERIYNSNDIFNITNDNDVINYINVDNIKIKRVRATAKLLGYSGYISKKEFFGIYLLFLKAEEPKFKDGELLFPRVELENILESKSDNSYLAYAKKIIEINKKNKS